MKKRFLPFSLLLVTMIFGHSVIADQGGHYVPRTQATMNSESYMGSLRANQNTGLIDPADMLKAMQAPVMRDGADDPLYWISMGPDNMGGQTTAVLYDNTPNSSGKPNGIVYIGSKGGGVYKTYNNGITWHQVGDMDLMVSTMVQDENGVIYVGTGDGNAITKIGNNTYDYNGLSQQGYDNSFIGTGIWSIDARNNDAMLQVQAPTAEDWLYINELAIFDGKLLAATPEGLRYTADKGQSWEWVKYIDENGEQQSLEGDAEEVKVASDGTIVASVDGQIFVGSSLTNLICHSGTGNQMQGDTLLPKAAGLLDVAIISNDSVSVLYASCVDGNGNHAGVFLSTNKGANWTRILPSVTSGLGHSIYEGYGLYNHGIVIDPLNDGVLYVTGYKLWRLTRPSVGDGYYQCQCITSNTTISSPAYLHVGLHVMTFNPYNPNEYYIGTDGGIYKGSRDFLFANCNRNYVTTRMFNVAFSGYDKRVLAAGLDHGTVLIAGAENANSPGAGLWINPTGDLMGSFSETSNAGPCAMSMINPNTIFVTYKNYKSGDNSNDIKAGLQRSETLGADWVSTNFTSSSTLNGSDGIKTSSFRLPILLYEDYDADWNPATVWYYNTSDETEPAGKVVECISNNKYPFDYALTAPLAAGDSVEVHDPVAAKMYLTFTDKLYVTLTPLDFSVEAEWYKISGKDQVGYSGEPLSMGISADGDNLFVGFKNGKFFRVSNLNTVVDAATGTYTNASCQVVTTPITLSVNGTNISQCVTSVSVDPRDANKVVATCGNYGNECYVFYSTNALSESPEFFSVQGNLPKMPVYSSLIERETGDVIIGTERGIYRTKNITAANWIADSKMLGEVPVMELKQQLLSQEDKQTVKITDDGTFITDYPGVHNTGIIYAATYGRGVFRCENYKVTGENVPETPVALETSVSIYPNPVRGMAKVSFNATENAEVSIQVFDLTGRMVMNQRMGRVAEGEQEISINTENLSTGSYILRLSQDGHSTCAKFMVY